MRQLPFRIKPLSAAIAAASLAGLAPNVAQAAAEALTAGGSTPNIQAPFVLAGPDFTAGAPNFAFNQNALFDITTDGATPANVDNLELVACLYDDTDTFVSAVRGGSDGGAATNAHAGQLSVPADAGTFTRARFGFVLFNDETGAAAADDTIDAIAAGSAWLRVTPGGAARNSFALTALDISATPATYTLGATGATTTEINNICGDAGFIAATAADSVTLDSAYQGPALQFAGADKETGSPDNVRLDFNAALAFAALGDNTNVSADVTIGTSTPTVNGAAVAGDSSITVDNASTAFGAAVTSVSISGGAVITDEAGNPAVARTATASSFEDLSYAPSGMAAIADGPGGGQSANSLWNHDGTPPTTGGSVGVNIRLDEPVDGGVDANDDFVVTGAGNAFVTVNTGTGRVLNVTVALDTGGTGLFFCFDPASGELQSSGDADCTTDGDDTTVTIELVASGASAPTAASTTNAVADLGPQNIVAGIDPIPVILTADADSAGASDGLLSGVEVDYGAPLAPLAGDTSAITGFTLRTNTAATGGASVTLNSKIELDPTDSSILFGNIGVGGLAASAEDWDGDTTANQADQDLFGDRANSNTGVFGAGTLFTFESTTGSSSATFSSIWSVDGDDIEDATDDGALALVSNGFFNPGETAPTADGAPPLIIDIDTTTLSAANGAATTGVTHTVELGTDPATGELVFVASEGLVLGGGFVDAATSSSDVNFDSSPLSLIHANVPIPLPTNGAPLIDTTEIPGDTLRFDDVSQDVDGTVLTSIGPNSGVEDASGNPLEAEGTQTVATGTPVANNPEIIEAVATRAGGESEGNIDTVVITFGIDGSPGEGVKLPLAADSPIKDVDGTTDITVSADGVFEDGMFRVRANVDIPGATDIDIDIPAANVDDSNAASGVIVITIPGNGIPGGQDVLNSVTVEYNDGTAANGNRLVSATGLVSVDEGGAEFTSADDEDSREAVLTRNSLAFYTQDITGIVTTDGTTPLQGAIVRATLINLNDTSGSPGATKYEFPDGGRFQVVTEPEQDLMKPMIAFSVDNENQLSDDIEDAEEAGENRIRRWMVVRTHQDGGHTAVLYNSLGAAEAAAAADTDEHTIHEARVFLSPFNSNLRGDIRIPASGTGIVGRLYIEEAAIGAGVAAFEELDTEIGVTDSTGNFRLNIGTDLPVSDLPHSDDLIVMVSVKQPGEEWVLVTPPEPNFCGFTRFRRDLANNNTSVTIRGDVGDIDLSKFELVSVDDNFNIAGPDGSVDGESDEGLDWQLLGFQGDICRTTTGHDVDPRRLFLTIDPMTGMIQTLWQDDGGTDDVAFTMRNSAMKSAAETSTGSTVDDIDDLRGGTGLAFDNDAVETGTLFIPINQPLPVSRNQGPGWQLITIVADVADPATVDPNIDTFIKVGNSNQAKSWFRGETDNSLNSLVKGQAYFAHFSAATTAFDFQ